MSLRAGIFLFIFLFIGCSSPPPPESFLSAPLRVRTFDDSDSGSQLLRMKPRDLFAAFDQNITKKGVEAGS
ncbi:hypothetical protein ACFL47_09270 [Candidatus Latescibacterota bacterium]